MRRKGSKTKIRKQKTTTSIGSIFGQLTTISEPFYSQETTYWMVDCICQCGNNVTAIISSLKNGGTKSCKSCKKKTYENKRTGTLFKNGIKQCGFCKQFRNQEFFAASRQTADKLKCRCKDCEYFGYIERKYKLTKEEYFHLWENQNKCCGICGIKQNQQNKRFHIDHKHDNTQKVRGILCNECNRCLGYFHDNIEIIRKAIKYIENENMQTMQTI